MYSPSKIESKSEVQELQELIEDEELRRRYPLVVRLAEKELQAMQQNVNPAYLDLQSERPVKLFRKILIPSPTLKGKIIGRGGEKVKEMRQTYKCSVKVLGSGSTNNPEGEAELLATGESKYLHLKEPLHVLIECDAPLPEAYERLNGVMQCLSELFGSTQSSSNRFFPPTSSSMGHGYSSASPSYTPISSEVREETRSYPRYLDLGGGGYGSTPDAFPASYDKRGSTSRGYGLRTRGGGGYRGGGSRGGGRDGGGRDDGGGPRGYESDTGGLRGAGGSFGRSGRGGGRGASDGGGMHADDSTGRGDFGGGLRGAGGGLRGAGAKIGRGGGDGSYVHAGGVHKPQYSKDRGTTTREKGSSAERMDTGGEQFLGRVDLSSGGAAQ